MNRPSHAAFAIALALCGLAHAADGVTTQLADTRRPNILFIMTDQQHAGMLSCTGNHYLRTPALDKLAATGTRFELAYVTNPVCQPSRFSLQTGRMPSVVDMRTNQGNVNIPPAIYADSLGALFKRAGYRCLYGGKSHFTPAMTKALLGPVYENLASDSRDKLTQACVDFLKRPHDRPFLLFASFINPHDVCYMAIHAFARSEGRPVGGGEDASHCEQILAQARKSGDLDAFVNQHCPPLPDNFEVPAKEPEGITLDYLDTTPFRKYAREHMSQRDWRLHRWLYARLTEESDRRIGWVLQALKDAGLEDNTIVVFTADHGDMDSAHRLEHKSVFYEESARVPFLVSWKGKLPSGQVDRRHLVSTGLDLLPTLCDYTGVEPPAKLPGRSLRPILEKQDMTQWRDYVVVENQNNRMIRTANFKYSVFNHGAHREMLSDLRRDPGEMTNLADAPESRDELNRHRRLLLEWTNRTDDRAAIPFLIKPD